MLSFENKLKKLYLYKKKIDVLFQLENILFYLVNINRLLHNQCF